MAETTYDAGQTVLDRALDLSRVRWLTIAALLAIVIGAGLRLAQLDEFPLSPAEARRAYQAYSFYRGSTSGPGQSLPETAPALALLQSLSFFLFGATDATARLASALLGLGIVLVSLALGRFISGPAAVGMAAFAAISPTLLYGSRIADPQIAVAFFSLFALYALLRIGVATPGGSGRHGWSIALGAALAAGYASAPTALTVYICLALALFVDHITSGQRQSALSRYFVAVRETPRAIPAAIASFAATIIILYSWLFTDFSALSGIGGALADWARLLTTTSSTTPTQFFLLAILLYEPLAVLFTIVGANRGTGSAATSGIGWSFFVTWFVAALLIFSFSSGRAPEHTILVALPLILLGGAALGEFLASFNWVGAGAGRAWSLFAVYLGLIVALIGFFVRVSRINDALNENQATFQALAIFIVGVVPFGFVTYVLVRRELAIGSGRYAALMILTVAAFFLSAYAIRSSVMLSFYNAVEGTEPLAQRTTTPAMLRLVERVQKLSRDLTVTEGSTQDPTGGHSVTIAIDGRPEFQARWPMRWYFRDFPFAQIVAGGQAPLSNAQIVIAPDDAGMAEAGYTPSEYPLVNRVPVAYTAPSLGDILATIVVPSRWDTGLRFLIEREPLTLAPPESVAVGFNAELANRLFPNTGPFGLFDRPGPGAGRGQFNGPRGIAVSPDGSTVYVVDMGNARVERFDSLGAFVGSWGGEAGGVSFERTSAGLGPTGITIDANGMIYVTDTWNHQLVVLDDTGREIRRFGTFQDTQDSPDPNVGTGMFFGPRAVAVSGDEIYVVDTGNERVQVFALDGTFRRAFGGYGSEPGKLIEPVGIALGPDGRVYVADSGNSRISIFASDGTPLEQWPVDAWLGHAFFEPYLTFDAAGYLYATSSATGSIEVFGPDGLPRESLTEINGERLQQPVGITTAPDGAIMITDMGRHAVFRYEPPPPAEEDEIVDLEPQLPFEASPEATPEATPAASPEASPAGSPPASNLGG
ncbi:MAG TPA: SMP-30/gluconolactonase/LRE family protein [Thermomicrobiales bacterium]